MSSTITKALGITLIGFYVNLGAPAMAIEQPKYEVIETIGDLEIRKYQPHNIARTLVPGAFSDVGTQGFRRLAGYIFGDNGSGQKISMTAPVVQEPFVTDDSGTTQDLADAYWLAFTMPSEHALDDLPQPSDDRVELVRLPEQYLAVLTYKGSWSEERYRQHEAKLILALSENEAWAPAGEPLWARYNSPMTPWFMRENDVAIVVIPQSDRLSGQAGQ
jgi:hypothetical protein